MNVRKDDRMRNGGGGEQLVLKCVDCGRKKEGREKQEFKREIFLKAGGEALEGTE